MVCTGELRIEGLHDEVDVQVGLRRLGRRGGSAADGGQGRETAVGGAARPELGRAASELVLLCLLMRSETDTPTVCNRQRP